MSRPPLRAVAADEKPSKPPKPLTVKEAAISGSHRDLLVAMRSRIAEAVTNPECPPRDLAALTRRLQDIAKEIDQLDLRALEEGDGVEFVEDEEWDAEAL